MQHWSALIHIDLYWEELIFIEKNWSLLIGNDWQWSLLSHILDQFLKSDLYWSSLISIGDWSSMFWYNPLHCTVSHNGYCLILSQISDNCDGPNVTLFIHITSFTKHDEKIWFILLYVWHHIYEISPSFLAFFHIWVCMCDKYHNYLIKFFIYERMYVLKVSRLVHRR